MTVARALRLSAFGLGVLALGLAGTAFVMVRPPTLLVLTTEVAVEAGDHVSLLITGDTGSGDDAQDAVAALMERLCAEVHPPRRAPPRRHLLSGRGRLRGRPAVDPPRPPLLGALR